ncbi:DUF124-domain-containing protein [Aspergillus campestris IBT 28561]|uniref:Altered inheritance of mitochondria protein 24, mitochondrial n=1 Tax=Aspergillus campestris (strain IBT 28561) TaxID=1392248 RepID=A0A2I1DDU8_ASPC2|nr:DUF124-domain-containing protein [Aspergillus campestris IBT 28561]PKY08045.1 DUF124-domain-containing protein [Aspergillus campestris IBT 28561]
MTNYAPPPAQETQYYPHFQSNSQASAGYPAPNFSYPPPPKQAVSPPPAIGSNNPYGASVSPPPQPSTPQSTAPAVQAHRSSVGSAQFGSPVNTTSQDDTGTFNGGSYRISHRDSNSIVTLQLAVGCPIEAKPGSMIAMSHSLSLRGKMNFSFKKLIAGGEMTYSTFTGPGELLLAPSTLGDIIVLRLSGTESWKVSKDGFLASTSAIQKEYQGQGLTKGVFSGEGLFIHKMSGSGLVWLQSFGAIIKRDIREGESYMVDNGHLVAWNCKYRMKRVAGGGIMSNLASGEGLVCHFDGPGTVYLQTRNAQAFAAHIGAHTASN